MGRTGVIFGNVVRGLTKETEGEVEDGHVGDKTFQ